MPDEVVPAEDRLWFQTFRKKVQEERIPVSAMLELTSRCNLRCQHCYLGPQEEQRKKRALEMSTEEVKRVLDQMVEAGCMTVTFTGGDPMVRSDFAELYRYAREQGLMTIVFCDAILVTDRILELFREYPPRRVEVSIYGASAQVYETVTRVKGSFEKAKRGIQRLLDNGTRVELKTVLMTLNQAELGEMRAWAESLGVRFRFDAAIFPCLPDSSKEPLDLRVDPEVVVQEEMKDPYMRTLWEQRLETPDAYGKQKQLYGCGAGRSSLYVGPLGDLSPCVMTTHYRYNLKERSLKELWNGQMLGFCSKEKSESFAQGRGGGLANLCSHCPAFNYLENGDEQKESPYGQELAEMRLRFLRAEAIKESEGTNHDDTGM